MRNKHTIEFKLNGQYVVHNKQGSQVVFDELSEATRYIREQHND